MKRIILMISLLCAVNSANAHGPLLDAMKDMGANFKAVAIAIQGGKFLQADLDASESLQYAVATGSLYYPKSADTDALKLKYSAWMAELNKKGLELEESIEIAMAKNPQDLTQVQIIFQEMNELRKKGHGEFKDEH